jgi:hypothetical protein
MLRRQETPSSDIHGSARSVRPSVEADDLAEPSFQTRAWRSLSRKTFLPDSEQSRIYHDWISRSVFLRVDLALIFLIDAGKPHNFVCSECRLPENLIGCGTCCRAYHAHCLPAMNTVPGFFHCSSCKEKAWDQAPPLLSSTTTDSGDATPGSSFQRREPPSRETPASIQGSPLMGYNAPGIASSTFPGRRDEYEIEYSDNLPPIFEMYSQVLAHLYQPDPDRGSVHRPEFLHQLNLMTREVESHRALLRKMATLREEFSKIQTENMQLRVYLNSRLPRDGNFAASNFSGYPRPSADTAGKSWDSIVMDLI